MRSAIDNTNDLHELYEWESSLSATERSILQVAYKLYVAQQSAGTCYNSAFFLCYYLKKHYSIDGRVEVGFIHDGVHPRTPSHAWYIYKDLVTDLSISRPLNPHLIRPGPLTILGRDIITGWPWRYFTAASPEGLRALDLLQMNSTNTADPMAATAYAIHTRMRGIATSKPAMRAYLDKCPPGMNYRDLVSAIARIEITPDMHDAVAMDRDARRVSSTRDRQDILGHIA